jgi:acetyl-CoA synthetase
MPWLSGSDLCTPQPGYAPTDALADDLIHCVAVAIHPHKRLREVEFTASLPRTPEGKLRRSELRAREGTTALPDRAASVGRRELLHS